MQLWLYYIVLQCSSGSKLHLKNIYWQVTPVNPVTQSYCREILFLGRWSNAVRAAGTSEWEWTEMSEVGRGRTIARIKGTFNKEKSGPFLWSLKLGNTDY